MKTYGVWVIRIVCLITGGGLGWLLRSMLPADPTPPPGWQLHLVRVDDEAHPNQVNAWESPAEIIDAYQKHGAWFTLDAHDLSAFDAPTSAFTLTAEAQEQLVRAYEARYPDEPPLSVEFAGTFASLWSGFVLEIDGRITCAGDVNPPLISANYFFSGPGLILSETENGRFTGNFRLLGVGAQVDDPIPCVVVIPARH